jgi:peptide/nickel transport system ATP-binding protein
MEELVKLTGLTKDFPGSGLLSARRRGVRAVDRVSLAIARDSIFGLVGESGCGKTSLARALLYLDPPNAGEVCFDGVSLANLSSATRKALRSRMQIVFQDPNSALDPRLRVGDSLEEGLINRGLPRRERRQRVAELLERMGISPGQRDRFPHQFSSGQKQRLVIARALAMEPDFLVLDEPVSNLDVSIQAQIINLLLDLKRELALTFLFISHDLNLVAYLSDTIAVMYRGRIVEQADAEELVKTPLHPYTRRLFAAQQGLPGGPGGPDSAAPLAAAAEARDGAALAAPPHSRGTPGCAFAPHCPLRLKDCLEGQPELRDCGGGHLVACRILETEASLFANTPEPSRPRWGNNDSPPDAGAGRGNPKEEQP